MKKLLLTTAFVAFLPFQAGAQEMVEYSQLPAGNYSLDETHASLTWKVSHMGLSNYTARFSDFDADLMFNPDDISASQLTVSVNPLSVTTDYPHADEKDFDEKLSTSEEWFNAKAFPDITFVSTAATVTGENTGTVTGDLTFMGVTKPLTLDVTYNGAYSSKPHAGVPALGFSATATLNRSEWGLDTYVPMIGDEVTLLIETEFNQDIDAENQKEDSE